MAQQSGIIQFRGKIDNLTFQMRDGKHIVGRKTGVNRERILTDHVFEHTRENMSDFKSAGKASKFTLSTMREVVLHKPDGKIMSRLQTTMIAVTRSDQSNPRGQKKPWAGDLSLLKNFEFNKRGEFPSVFWAGFTPTIDRVAGECKAVIPPYDPKELVNAPEGTTHYRIVVGGVELDFEGETFVRERALSGYIPWVTSTTSALTLTANVTPNSTLPLFLVIGIEFARQQDAIKIPLNGGRFNPVQIVKVDA